MRSVRTTYSSSRGPTLPSELEHSPPSHDTSSRSSPKELRGVRATREEDKDLERQPSGYCIYGLGGELLHAPEGARCPVVKAASRSAGSGAAARPGGAGSCLSGDCAEGNGSYGWPDGSRFVGTFEGGRPHGYGTLVRPDGSSYVGDWRHGLRSGQGMGISADGRVQSGVWNEGRFSGGGPRTRNIAVESFHWPDLSRPAARVGGGEGDAAVIVGLETYAYVPEIPLAAENASAWYRYLIRTRGVPLDRVALLIDDDATLEEMESAARTAGERVKRGGTLWYVFIGHGAPSRDGSDGLLVGFDAQRKTRSIEARSLSRKHLLSVLEESRAGHINVLIDACFSGRSPTGTQLVAGLQPLVVTALHETADPRITVLTAARSDEYAGPLPGAGRPAFSYLALGGLRGWADADADGTVTGGELHGYISRAMQVVVRGRRQRPTLVGLADTPLARSARDQGPDLATFVAQRQSGAR